MSTSLNLYVFPNGPQRLMGIIVAPNLKAAKRHNGEATLATREQITGLLVAAVMVPRVSGSGREKGFSQPEDFGLARNASLRTV